MLNQKDPTCSKLHHNPVYNTCTLLENNVKYVDANLDAPDNAISDKRVPQRGHQKRKASPKRT